MTDTQGVLATFHAALVDEIRAQQPEYMTSPFTVAEIYQNLVPYATHRDRVGVEMNGDYEDALLRLLAGEGGYLMLESEPALRNLREELESFNPNTGLYREFAAVDVRLNPAFIDVEGHAVPHENDGASNAFVQAETVSMSDLAPPDFGNADTDEEMPVDEPEVGVKAGAPGSEASSACRWCRAELPERDNLNFCPFCGTDVNLTPCPGCSEELDPAWRFCVACGTEVNV
jgi:hypothetical protein